MSSNKNARLAQAGLAQAGLAQAGLAQAGLAQAGLAQAAAAAAEAAKTDHTTTTKNPLRFYCALPPQLMVDLRLLHVSASNRGPLSLLHQVEHGNASIFAASVLQAAATIIARIRREPSRPRRG